MVALGGKITSEIGVEGTAEKWFNLFSKQLHDIQHFSERVHATKLHEGDDWHNTDSVKHWTYIIDGEVVTCHERIESIDEENKTIVYKLYGDDHIDKHFKKFNFIIQSIDDKDKKYGGSVILKWSVEYEKISDDVHPPYAYIDFIHHNVKDFEHNLLKA